MFPLAGELKVGGGAVSIKPEAGEMTAQEKEQDGGPWEFTFTFCIWGLLLIMICQIGTLNSCAKLNLSSPNTGECKLVQG